jgi:hypothetical protein
MKAGLSSVYSTLINTYEFAQETLHPVIPDLLDQGLGRPQVNRINKLQNATIPLEPNREKEKQEKAIAVPQPTPKNSVQQLSEEDSTQPLYFHFRPDVQ